MMGRKRRFKEKDWELEPGSVYVAPASMIYVGILFCLVFAGIGAAHFIPSLAPRLWKSVPCEVVEFEIQDDVERELPFSARVRYRFEWASETHEGTLLGIEGWKRASDPIKLALGFSVDEGARCYLPDGEAASAVLLRPPPKWGGLAFIGFGLSIGWILFQANYSRNREASVATASVLPTVALFFGTIGVVLFFFMSWPLWRDQARAGDMMATPATVVWGAVRKHKVSAKGGRRTTYRPDICYEYKINGKTWRNNGHSFNRMEDFSQGEALAVVEQHPAGKAITCWVDPSRPEAAVLKKEVGWSWLVSLFPLPFIAVGLMCGWTAFRTEP